ncbi:MAG: DNA translocase FtsK 4TM domain-containing protein, partial [Thermodesulfovibrio sp.]|nr:DNA translocase FtsK 4TM domain-containing protein [Thermodesulfovibrio sp.]
MGKKVFYRKPSEVKANITALEPEKGRTIQPLKATDIFKAVLLIAFAVYIAVSVLTYNILDPSFFTYTKSKPSNFGGIIGSYLADILLSLFGIATFLLPLIVIFLGIRKFLGKAISLSKLPWLLTLIFSVAVMLEPLREFLSNYKKLPEGLSWIAFHFCEKYISMVGTYIFWFAISVASVILIKPTLLRKKSETEKEVKTQTKNEIKVVKVSKPEEPIKEPEVSRLKAEEIRIGKKEIDERQKIEAFEKGFILPPLSLLKIEKNEGNIAKEEIIASARSIESRFAEFGIHGTIKEVHPGPVVTMYEFEPASGIKLSKIITLSDELALSLRAQSIRIYPIPGRSAIGIEVPNKKREIV